MPAPVLVKAKDPPTVPATVRVAPVAASMIESAPRRMLRLASSVKLLRAERPPPWKTMLAVGVAGAVPKTLSAATWMVPALM